MIRHFFALANAEPIKLKFLYVLINDYSFAIDSEMRDNIFKIINVLVFDGYTSGQLDKNVSEADLYLYVIINTIQYINQSYKNAGKQIIFEKKDEDHLVYLTRKILK
jgi:hypothetical protein